MENSCQRALHTSLASADPRPDRIADASQGMDKTLRTEKPRRHGKLQRICVITATIKDT